jgi:DNA (cytosine-5)-methyltransferase 1
MSPSAVLKDLGLPEGRQVDLVAGCPPCQGFTRLTESKRGRDKRNGLVRHYLRFVRAIRPKACMLENVPGLLTTKKGRKYFNELRKGLEDCGYHVSFEIAQLADYGIPQFRKRLVLLAGLKSSILIPKPTHCAPDARPRLGRRPWKTVRDAIAKFSKPPRRSAVLKRRSALKWGWHYTRDISPIVRRRIMYALKHGRSRSTLPPSLRLACHARHPGGYNDVYGTMEWDRPSPTITSGCTNASKGRFGHPSQARALTAREAATLQTFPSTYRFRGSGIESVAAQIGNALPRQFAIATGKAILRSLRK